MNSEITTPRMVLEPRIAAHAAFYFQPMQNPKIYEWVSTPPPQSLEALTKRYALGESRMSPDFNEAWLNWSVRRKSDGRYLGYLDAAVNQHNVAVNVGYVIFPDFWNQGFASEAVRALVAHLDSCGVIKMIATVTEGNLASYRVLEKAGFVRTRVIPDNDTIRGVKYNDVEFEWLTLRS